jgi:tetratricopeptide (TPR) repeat protein
MIEAPSDQEGRPPNPDSGVQRTAFSRRRRFLAVLVLLLAAGLWGWPWLTRQLDRRKWLRTAEQGGYAEVEPHLKRLLERNPHDIPVLRVLAIAHMESGNMAAAEPYLESWCALRPGDTEPFRRRMELRRRLGRDREALGDGLRVLEADPEDLEVRREVCKLMVWDGRLEEAETHCRLCLRIAPGDKESQCWLAQILHDRGNNADAEALLEPLLRDDPHFAPALLLRAILYHEADQSAKAIPLLERAITVDHGFVEVAARYQLGLVLARIGRNTEAQQVIAKVQQQRLAESFLTAGKTDDAIRLLEGIVQQDPQYVSARILLSQCYQMRNQTMQEARRGQGGR